MKVLRSAVRTAIVSASLVPLAAQWLHYPTPGLPRTADGKPNLSGPAPKTAGGKPDFTGIWGTTQGRFFQDLGVGGVEIPMLPWARSLYEERKANLQKGHPSERCLGHGVTDFDTHATPRRLIQTPQVIAILYESYHQYRQIFLDGRPLPKMTQPAYMGYSTGRWEGDTLVVETSGFNDIGWLDMNGHPQTEETRLTERFRRPRFGHIDITITVTDPKAYSKPWTVPVAGWDFLADEELVESICENEKDFKHMVGK